MFEMKKILFLLIGVFSISSCVNDVKSNSPALQAKFNDEVWRAKQAYVEVVNGALTITAFTLNETVIIKTSSANPGTYVLGTTDQNNFISYSKETNGSFSDYDTSVYEGPAYKIDRIVASGTGYSNSNNSFTTPVTGIGSGLRLAVETNTNGNITNVSIVSRGDGYKAGDIVKIVGGNDNATVRILNTQQCNGEIVIEKVENGAFTGSFKFNAVDNESGEVVTFSNGIFYNLSSSGL